MLRKLRDRDRSESPMIDDDATTASDHSNTNQRSRRRYSSTPLIDSIPNSPASDRGDERDNRISKKSLLSICNALQPSKHAVIFQKNYLSADEQEKFDEICLRPMDWQTIKRNIDNGNIKSFADLQRDIMLMCQNALMFYPFNSSNYKMAQLFMQECNSIREFISNSNGGSSANNNRGSSESLIAPKDKRSDSRETREARESRSSSNASLNTSSGSSSVKVRGSSRKSQRIS